MNNYRETSNQSLHSNHPLIAFTSCITKIFDLVVIKRYRKNLETSELQFSYKGKQSIAMCNMSMKETVRYYGNRGSKVYACFMDASKAFGRIRYDKLFAILLNHGLPCVVVRTLLDMYMRQKVRTSWQGVNSEYFSISNGIRQGGILSPILYTIYADELLIRLSRTGMGCHVGHMFAGALCYADDMVLLCPSIKGLQMMINICRDFGVEYDVKYNDKKTVCMCFDNGKNMEDFKVLLNEKVLQCVESTKHLGITVTYNLSDSLEIRRKRGDFIGRVNGTLTKYRMLGSEAKTKLFNSYCTHMYGTETWNFREARFTNVLTSWNIAVRTIWDLPHRAHRRYLAGLNGAHGKSIEQEIYARATMLYKKMENSENSFVKFLTQCCKNDSRSLMSRNTKDIKARWERQEYDKETQANILLLKEINVSLEGLKGFTKAELMDMYDHIAVV